MRNVLLLVFMLAAGKVIILLVAYQVTHGLPPNLPSKVIPFTGNATSFISPAVIIPPTKGWPAVLEGVSLDWDGALYQQIASHGYIGTGSTLYAFSPAYPALIFLAHLAVGPYWVSDLLAANVLSFVFPIVLLRLFDFRTALIAEVFPTYLVFTTVGYSDGLALVFLGLAFLFFFRGRYLYAGAALAAASLVFYDLLLAAPAFALYILLFGRHEEGKRWRSYAALLLPSVLAGLGLLIWYQVSTGNIFTFFNLERSSWGVVFTNPVGQAEWLFGHAEAGSFNILPWTVLGFTLTPGYWLVRNMAFEAFFFAGVLLVAGFSGRERWLFVIYSLVISVPLLFLDGTVVYSIPRLLLPAFPVFLAYSKRVFSRNWLVMLYVVLAVAVSCWAMASFLLAFFA